MDALSLYALLAATTAPPLVPNSALLVTAGVLASQGHLALPVVLLVVAGSAFAGDIAMCLLARRYGGPLCTGPTRGARSRRALDRARTGVRRHGVPFVVAVRFLPSGRILSALTCGALRYPLRRYALGAGVAEVVWATYSVGLGYLGSAAVGRTLYAGGVGFAVSCAVAGLAVLAGWVSRRPVLRRLPFLRARVEGSAAPARPRGRLSRAPAAPGGASAPDRASAPRD